MFNQGSGREEEACEGEGPRVALRGFADDISSLRYTAYTTCTSFRDESRSQLVSPPTDISAELLPRCGLTAVERLGRLKT